MAGSSHVRGQFGEGNVAGLEEQEDGEVGRVCGLGDANLAVGQVVVVGGGIEYWTLTGEEEGIGCIIRVDVVALTLCYAAWFERESVCAAAPRPVADVLGEVVGGEESVEVGRGTGEQGRGRP